MDSHHTVAFGLLKAPVFTVLANPTGCHKMPCVSAINCQACSEQPEFFKASVLSHTWASSSCSLFHYFTWWIPTFLVALKSSLFSFEETSRHFLSRARHFLLSCSLSHTSFGHVPHDFCDPELDSEFLDGLYRTHLCGPTSFFTPFLLIAHATAWQSAGAFALILSKIGAQLILMKWMRKHS